MDIVFDRGRTAFMLDAIGLSTDDDGYVVTANGDYAPVSDGRKRLHKDNIGYIQHDESVPCDTILVPDDFSAIVRHLSDNRNEQ